jgi:hypothetical protein
MDWNNISSHILLKFVFIFLNNWQIKLIELDNKNLIWYIDKDYQS